MLYEGSTSDIIGVGTGIVTKKLREFTGTCSESMSSRDIEHTILQRLGDHPRIVKYLGLNSDGDILLLEANRGSLQRWINEHTATAILCRRWCYQIAEAIAYIHHKGVIHSDLRPENILVHASASGSLDLWLCDFGGSTFPSMGLDGDHLPDAGFFDPRLGYTSTQATDIFSMGSVFYTIATGFWPFRSSREPFQTWEELMAYTRLADDYFTQGIFPPVENELELGEVIMGCWTHKYSTAEDVVVALRKYLSITDIKACRLG